MKKMNQMMINVIILPYVILVLVEAIHRGSVVEAIEWTFSSPFISLLNYGLIFGLLHLLFFIKKGVYWIWLFLLMLLMNVVAYISHVKVELRGDPFLPWDIFLMNEATNVSKEFDGVFSISMVWIILAFLMIYGVYVWRVHPRRTNRKSNAAITIVAAICLISIYSTMETKAAERAGIENFGNEQAKNYEHNGIIYGFVGNIHTIYHNKIDGYNRKAIIDIAKEQSKQSDDPAFKPNVITLQSETLWDPTQLEGIEFSKDPIPYIRQLMEEYTSGQLVVPVFGGGTANTEFEGITGMSMQNVLNGSSPFNDQIHRPMDSLATMLKRYGYNTTAVHTYHNWFYHRNDVYRNLGFDRFISGEFFSNPKQVGPWVDDSEMVKMMVSELKRTKGSDYIHAVSLEAHGPYKENRFPEYNIDVEGKLTPESKKILRSYVQSLVVADQAVKELIEELKQLDEPTIVVMWGDHLPGLGEDYKVYREAGYYKGSNTYKEYLKMHTTPIVVWDNFKETKPKETLHMSANFITPYLLDRVHKKGNALTNELMSLYTKGERITPIKMFEKDEHVSKKELKRYQLLQYDMLYGNGYVYGVTDRPFVNEDYRMGQKTFTITEVDPARITKNVPFNLTKGKSILNIWGTNFVTPQCCLDYARGTQVFINGERQTTIYATDTLLSVAVPKKFFQKPGTLTIQLKVVDIHDAVLSSSNVKTITVK